MPRVPRVSTQQVQQVGIETGRANLQPINAPQPDASQFTAVNKAGRGVLSTALDIEQKEIQKGNELRVTEADMRLSEIETQMLYDRSTGAMNKKGKEAFSLPDEVLPEWDKQVDEITKTLSNDEQKAAVKKMAMQRRQSLNKQIYQHMSREGMVFDDEVTKSYIANERDAALANFHDEERVQMSIDRQLGAITKHADRMGLPGDALKLMRAEATSKTYFGVISKIADGGEDQQALKYYEKYKDQLTGEDQGKLEKFLEASSLRGESQRQTEAIWGDSGGDLGAALAQARRIEDPKLQDEVRRRIQQRHSDKKIAEEAQQVELYQDSYNTLQEAKSLDAIPPSRMAAMKPSQQETLRKLEKAMRSGKSIETDMPTYYNLKLMASSPSTRNKFMQTNLLEYADKLNKTELKQLMDLQGGLQKEDPAAKKLADGIETQNSIVSTALGVMDIQTGSKASPEEKQRAAQFRREVDKRVVEKQEATGREVTNEELRQITDMLTTEVVYDRNTLWWDSKKRLFEVNPGDQIEIEPDAVPKAERLKIEAALRKYNKPVTDEAVVEMYSRKIQGTEVRQVTDAN